MKRIIKYMLHKNNNNNLVTPGFVNDGGYFPKNNEYIGVSEDDEIVYLPETIEKLTNQDFIDYVKTLTMKDDDGNLLSDDDKEAIANNWINNHIGN